MPRFFVCQRSRELTLCTCLLILMFLPVFFSSARVSFAADIVRTVASGAWTEASVWSNGRIPAQGDRVLIRPEHSILYNAHSDVAIRVLKIAGTLRFATDHDTRLDVGLIKVEAGEDVSEEGFDCNEHSAPEGPGAARPALLVGSQNHPVREGFSALIRLVYFEGMDKESCPAIVCCGGRMEFHGTPMNRTWVKLAATIKDGATEIELAEPVRGWRSGDRVLIPTTAGLSLFEFRDKERRVIPTVRDRSHSEERTIKSVDGTKLVLDKPLAHRHRCDGDFRGEVANLSRNVVIESADPGGIRGHTMYHANSQGSISYAEFRHLGKRGVLGRYSLHFHLCRDSMRGASVVGASIHDSDNRWLTV
ncbi:MAG TPA: G8 domain-containing protein, partial [Pirellulales bacterium]|nr:G8 domain-containing protein [Pirellulales bacterium]